MNDEIAKNNAKYIMEIMYKTLNYTTLNRGATNDVDHWLSRYAVASYTIANALEKEQNAVSIIGKYDEVVNNPAINDGAFVFLEANISV